MGERGNKAKRQLWLCSSELAAGTGLRWQIKMQLEELWKGLVGKGTVQA